MKRLLFSLMIIVAIFSIAGVGGSLAYFSDDEAATDNTLKLGVWDLDIDSGTLVIQNVSANQTGAQNWTVTSIGTIPAYLDLDIDVTEVGGLVNQVAAKLSVDGFPIYGWAAISGLEPGFDLNLPLGVGASADIKLDWAVDAAYTNNPGDSVTVVIDFDFQPTP
jgi:predicted ribosomally synthesized peptide with SipW-like signal peptide